jgi:type II secretory pathway pseudopilin PulG
MSSSLDGLAVNLTQVAARLRAAAAEDDGELRRRHGATLTKLRIMRDRSAAAMAPGDPCRAGLAKVDAALADLTAAFNALPRAPLAIEAAVRPRLRRRSQRAARLDADTAKLLKRAAIILGLSGAAALPMAAAAGSCTVGTTQVCTGDFTTGLDITGGALTALVQNLTANIMPASGTIGIKFDGAGSEGSHNGAGSNGEPGGPGPNLTLNTTDTAHTVITTGANALGIAVRSFGGGAGNGGGGVSCPICFPGGGDGGRGGAGGTVVLSNLMGVTTGGDYAAGVYALSRGGQGGAGGDSNGSTSAGTGGPGGDAGIVLVTNGGKISTSGFQAHGVYAASIGGNGGIDAMAVSPTRATASPS